MSQLYRGSKSFYKSQPGVSKIISALRDLEELLRAVRGCRATSAGAFPCIAKEFVRQCEALKSHKP